MNATTTNRAGVTSCVATAEKAATTESSRFAQNGFLTELPGIAFGLLTLAYLVSSLIHLA